VGKSAPPLFLFRLFWPSEVDDTNIRRALNPRSVTKRKKPKNQCRALPIR
jgi:hypothetical protein